MFYLQTGGVVMDYQGWRKRPFTPQFLSFMLAHPLEGAEELPALQPLTPAPAPTPALVPSTPATPQGAEIKIPGVGVTPVAVSTQLPAAVAQLTQQGMSLIHNLVLSIIWIVRILWIVLIALKSFYH